MTILTFAGTGRLACLSLYPAQAIGCCCARPRQGETFTLSQVTVKQSKWGYLDVHHQNWWCKSEQPGTTPGFPGNGARIWHRSWFCLHLLSCLLPSPALKCLPPASSLCSPHTTSSASAFHLFLVTPYQPSLLSGWSKHALLTVQLHLLICSFLKCVMQIFNISTFSVKTRTMYIFHVQWCLM